MNRPAPLFYSAADEFREDDENECEREIADFYALQKSRRHFGSIHLRDSSEMDEDDISTFHEHKLPNSNASRKSKGIRSSWRDSESNRGRHNATADTARKSTQNGGSSCRARENLFNVRLDDTIGFDYYMDKASSETGDDDPPSIQRFREQPGYRKGSLGIDSSFIPTETDKRTRLESGLPEIPSDSYLNGGIRFT
ncbi:hypothetical protein EYZ11_007906 [Aspergillus tanneri]|uniref:Uncharacterized protein n=1 Tax=Aspergillus tanneri TaxID=1220188 RepID=A0A4V3UNV5_9EURO|nr:hypothetical protein EYZ11_007906 [Aspergillus tanneri]